MTAELLETLDRARRRSYLRSGVLGVHVFTGLLVSGVALGVAVSEDSPGFLVLLRSPPSAHWPSSATSDTAPGPWSKPTRSAQSLAVHVDDDGIRVTRAHGTVGTPWATGRRCAPAPRRSS